MRRIVHVTTAVGVAALIAGGVFAVPAAAAGSHPAPPGMTRMHELMAEGNPGMARMCELMAEGNPGMERMHEPMMGE